MMDIHCPHIGTYSLLCNGIIHSLDDEISTDDESVLGDSQKLVMKLKLKMRYDGYVHTICP